jgi:nitrate/TMAO reductase-like tetraheme cytochrome c subunit
MRALVLPALVVTSALMGACSSTDTSGENETYSRDKLLDPETCNECHQDHYKEWSGSMHAYSSEDPVFRAMNARGQEETHGDLGDFCVKCHAPMAVAEGETTDGLNLDSVPKELQGVTCYFCHNVKEVQDTHPNNNPLLLANDTTMRGPISDPVRYSAHESEYSESFNSRQLAPSSKMCGACHDIVVPGHFSGAPADVPLEQTYAEWQQTVFAVDGPPGLSCGGCHLNAMVMQPVAAPPNSKITMPVRAARHEHLFAAVDSAHGDFPEKDAQLAAIQAGIDGLFRIQLCVDENTGLLVNLQLENIVAGHSVPSGASADRRLWAEIHVFKGDVDTYQSGVIRPGESVSAAYEAAKAGTAGAAPFFTAWDKATKVDGTTAHMFWDVANIQRDSVPGLQPGLAPTIQNIKGFNFRLRQVPIFQPTKVTTSVWLEPVGTDLLEDLERSGHLKDDSIRKGMRRYVAVPKRVFDPDAPNPVSMTWTPDARDRFTTDGLSCVESTPKNNR